ncbi:hypothetical protein HAN_2g319 (nucleomorph) [Hemiselmis andersenii]|uniref:60S acidic ribosomal protein P1 n=1 Tax=Hemiselmis andersenii TaxID=464988 RepID=A9BKY2_HEMAN|nr:hypothetical protein HAN_2g319 [Hemiselmis andersenii]ABW98137.1 hypothetical protein HAN_2g319 [Hemiselmis andersenii]
MWENKNKSEVACILAGLILSENNLSISESNIKKILNCTEVKVENFWPILFSRLMDDFEFESPVNSQLASEKPILKNEKDGDKSTKKPSNTSDIPKESEEDLGFGLFD